MPRIRTIKPRLWESEKVGRRTGLARLTFVGMICHADDEGRGRGSLEALRADCHKYDSAVTSEALRAAVYELVAAKLVVFYVIAGCTYYWLPGFRGPDGQKIDRPSPSRLPAPPSFSPDEPVLPGLDLPVAARPAPPDAPDDFIPPAADAADEVVLKFPVVGAQAAKTWDLMRSKQLEYAEAFPGVDVSVQCRVALQWCRDNPTKRKTPANMAAFLSRWLADEQNKGAKGTGAPKCPLCQTGAAVPPAVVCTACARCRKCNKATANLKIGKRPDGTVTAWCPDCVKQKETTT